MGAVVPECLSVNKPSCTPRIKTVSQIPPLLIFANRYVQ